MKRKLLLFLAAFLISDYSFAQAVANPVSDLTQCGNTIFDLTVTANAALGNQSPNQFTVSWYMTMMDADNDVNPIANPNAFYGTNEEVVWLRVTNMTTQEFDVTSFTLHLTGMTFTPLPDVTACGFYTLPVLNAGQYYSQPNAQGQPLPAGTTIAVTMMVYVHGSGSECDFEDSFMVFILPFPTAPMMNDVTICSQYVLPELNAGNYYTGPGGTGTMLQAGTTVTESMTIYVFVTNGFCTDESSFEVILQSAPDIDVEDVTSCTPYQLPALPDGQMYYLIPGAAPVEAGTIIYETQDVYVGAQNGNCGNFASFTVTVGDFDFDPQPMTACSLNGFGTFDFNALYAEINALSPSANVAIYLTLADALAQAAPVLPIYTAMSSFQVVYVRIENMATGCFSIHGMTLQTFACTNSSISGVVQFDADSDGCDASDVGLEGIQITCTNGNHVFYAYTNAQGEYTFEDVFLGNNFISVVNSTLPTGAILIGNPTQTVNVTGDGQQLDANFCVNDANDFMDAGIFLYANWGAVPGFAAHYTIYVHNGGALPISGSVTLTYDEAKLNFVSSSPAPASASTGSITVNFTDIEAFGSLYIPIQFNVETPPTANSGDVLHFNATVSIANDINPNNNVSVLNQTVVNSYDPNDITVHEGTSITPQQASDYLHYTIRFQNTGTAPAVNVRLENELADLLDWNTFRPVASSHAYLANRDGNQVTFNFYGINLAAEQDDEPASHGYIVYEIKPVAGIQLGDTIENTAEIYFDFNPAIVTNTATTTVEQLSTPENQSDVFVLYPNPASGSFIIRSVENNQLDMEITDVRGSTVLSKRLTPIQNESVVDISGLSSGLYFVKLSSENASLTKKLIIR
ncbi:T9SS type A sorting domain-containing protein [Flavobacterium sp. MAH-1]|uniref:T9SS type A sorting domain-containing protein n=1 Tax=Flavobacterium agri TaxID=2743471 RepID=A0A7Y8Y302_9FLAO|nr:T9SS type A sorting domain-containing protein [Flavobacterium agri]NUY81538.1 T9SS type A sorting domain-containing protein [Flavobacterium agri]NYA71562.1 T9SS type A sorting domain-containing protein [Flavobacterium agri]